MAKPRRDQRNNLPKAHFSTVTWVGIAVLALVLLLYVVWLIWFAEPGYMQ